MGKIEELIKHHDRRRSFWRSRYDLPIRQYRRLTPKILDQLDKCKTREIERLILGISK